MNVFTTTLLLSLAIQVAFFAIATTFKTDKVTDLSYGLTFIALALWVVFGFDDDFGLGCEALSLSFHSNFKNKKGQAL